jgi:hypothetical protein
MIYENANVEKAFLKREQEPFRRKQSEYGRRLLEKQKVMFYYGMREGQMRKFFNIARRTKGNTSKAFLIAAAPEMLEACEYALKYILSLDPGTDAKDRFGVFDLINLQNYLEAAITKAKGEV